jgi:hypothetical protein
MIYKFPINQNLLEVLSSSNYSRYESFAEGNLPLNKIGEIVSTAILVKNKCGLEPILNTKVSIGKRDKIIEIIVKRDKLLFLLAFRSKHRSEAQIQDLAEVHEYIMETKIKEIDLVTLILLNDIQKPKSNLKLPNEFSQQAQFFVQRSTICDTLNKWQS